ncbi:hypothetical protein PMIN07_007592 [Paraphaeosphaeria minitans]
MILKGYHIRCEYQSPGTDIEAQVRVGTKMAEDPKHTGWLQRVTASFSLSGKPSVTDPALLTIPPPHCFSLLTQK